MKLFWSVGIILAIYYYCYIYSPTFSSGVQSQRIQEWRSKGRYFLFESQNATHSIFYIDEKTSSGNNVFFFKLKPKENKNNSSFFRFF